MAEATASIEINAIVLTEDKARELIAEAVDLGVRRALAALVDTDPEDEPEQATPARSWQPGI